MAPSRHTLLDVVALGADCGRWPARTMGTVVEADSARALVEVSDDRGHGLDFIALLHDVLARVEPAEPRACPDGAT